MTERVRSSKVAQKLVRSIVDHTRQMSVLQRDIEVKRGEIDRLNTTGQVKYASRENELMNLAMILMQLQDQQAGGMEADTIFIDDEDPVIRGRRRNMAEFIQNLRFLYTFDPVGDVDGEVLRVVERVTPEWNGQIVDPRNRYRQDNN